MMWEIGEDAEERLVADSEELVVMRQIAEWRIAGWTWRSIYFELLKRRVKTRDSREWSVTRIGRAYEVICRTRETLSTESS
jgi:hypothetical protein